MQGQAKTHPRPSWLVSRLSWLVPSSWALATSRSCERVVRATSSRHVCCYGSVMMEFLALFVCLFVCCWVFCLFVCPIQSRGQSCLGPDPSESRLSWYSLWATAVWVQTSLGQRHFSPNYCGAGIAESVACWACCPAWCSGAGSNLLVASSRGEVSMGSDSIPWKSFGWEFKPGLIGAHMHSLAWAQMILMCIS